MGHGTIPEFGVGGMIGGCEKKKHKHACTGRNSNPWPQHSTRVLNSTVTGLSSWPELQEVVGCSLNSQCQYHVAADRSMTDEQWIWKELEEDGLSTNEVLSRNSSGRPEDYHGKPLQDSRVPDTNLNLRMYASQFGGLKSRARKLLAM